MNEEIEYNSFEELNSNQTSALEAIGFEEDSHDCCHNHYISYDWSELSDIDYIGVKTAWELIGYNEQNWMNISLQELIPPYDDYDWDELPQGTSYHQLLSTIYFPSNPKICIVIFLLFTLCK